MAAELLTLANLITTQAQIIDGAYKSAGKQFHSLNDANSASALDEIEVVRATSIAIAAASRIVASLRNPYVLLQEASGGMYTSALLNVAVETNVVEALREAGPQGMHVKDLAPKIGMDPSKLARCLRYLCATRHIFQEVSPHVFANNRISISMDTGRPFDDIFQDRGPERYATGGGCAAMMGTNTDEGPKGALALPATLLDPKTAFGHEASQVPIMRGVGFDGEYFKWLEQPGNELRLHRFGVAMKNSATLFSPDGVLSVFDWRSLPKGGIVVDVGGSIGATTLPLARSFPDLRFIVQDRLPVIGHAEKFWSKVNPTAIESGQVTLQAHDFFQPQNIENASVFMLRFVLHMLPDPRARQVLKHLRARASPCTRLLLLELIVPYTCPTHKVSSLISGSEETVLPDVLQGNMGVAEDLVFAMDIQMMNFLGSQERTIDEWANLFESADWELKSVQRDGICAIVGVPV